jgi:L-lysine 2,3-aminomutase
MTCRTLEGFTLEEAINDNQKRALINRMMDGTTDILLRITEYLLHGLTEKEIVSRLRKKVFPKSKGLTAWVRDACSFIHESQEGDNDGDIEQFKRIMMGAIDLTNQNFPQPYK